MKKATTTMKKRKSGPKEGKGGDSPSQLIDARIKELNDWRGRTITLNPELVVTEQGASSRRVVAADDWRRFCHRYSPGAK
jgi:hypothetical protein